MTLTLDEVNRIRFPMARRPNEGYRAGEVDDFVDNVVATFTAMNAETDRLKAQLDALKSGGGEGGSDSGAELARLGQENESLRRELEQLRQRGDGDQGAPADNSAELDELRRANGELEQRAHQAEAQLAQVREQRAQNAAAFADGGGRVENVVVTTSAEASSSAIRLVSLATEQAERVISDADAEAAEKKAEAERAAAEATAAAQARAEEIRHQAQSEADKLLADAKAGAEQVDVDARSRRDELFTSLEHEREEFAAKVDQLKAWESHYRTRLVDHLRGQADALQSGTFEPDEAPTLAGDERSTSATPRLDALLADRQ